MNKLFKTLVIVGLVGIAGVASAALVSYLSDAVSVEAELTSPFSMNINEGRDGSVNSNTLLNIQAYSGAEFTFTTVATNLSDTDLQDFGYRVVVVTAPGQSNFTGGEITKVMAEHAWSEGPEDITQDIYVVGSNGSLLAKLTEWTGTSKRLVLITSDDGDIPLFSLEPNQSDWNAFTMTTNIAIEPGDYTIESRLVYDLTAFAAEEYAK